MKCHLVHILIFLVLGDRLADAKLGHVGWAKSDSRTKQILQNLRSHLAQQAKLQAELQAKDCDPKSGQCLSEAGIESVVPEEDAEEAGPPPPEATLPPFRFRARHKTKDRNIAKENSAKERRLATKRKVQEEMMKLEKRREEEKKARGLVESLESEEDKSKQKKAEKKKDDSGEPKRKKGHTDEGEKPKRKRDIHDEDKRKPKEDDGDNKAKRKKHDDNDDDDDDDENQDEKKRGKRRKDDDEDDDDDDKKRGKRGKHDDDKKRGKRWKDDDDDKDVTERKSRGKRQTDGNNEESYDRSLSGKVNLKAMSKKREDTGKVKRKVLPLPVEKPLLPKKQSRKVSLKRPEGKPEEVDGEKDVRFPDDVHVFSLASDAVKSERCRQHSRVYLRQLKRYKIWALMMYDSTAKLPSGILQGNANQYGDFDQCLSVNATFKKRGPDGVSGIEGKYCLATVDVTSNSSDPGLRHAIHRSQSFGFVKSTINDPGHFIPRFSTVNWGLCIPSACRAEDLENSMKSSLNVYGKSSGLVFDVKVEDRNCVTKRDLLSEYDVRTFVTLFFYAAVIGVAAFATFRDVARKKRKSGGKRGESDAKEGVADGDNDSEHGESDYRGLIASFSLLRTAKKLFVEEESGDSIDCIHGIKSIFTMMLYFAHKLIPLALTPFVNRVALTEVSNDARSVLLRGSIIYTDSFLLISGVLISYNLSKELARTGRILWFRRIFARFIRLTPALLATLLFYGHVSHLLGTGPAWNAVVGENARLCRENMWRNLLYIQNFFPFEEMCAPQTHQLALDMQLFLVSPVLVYILHVYDKIGVGILQALLMVSSIARFIATTNYDLSVFIFHGMSTTQLYDTANHLYCQPLHRATPYIVGLIVGYYLQKHRDVKLPKFVAPIGWTLSIALALGTLILPAHLAKQDYVYSPSEAAHYAALSPIAWSVALAWFITACHLGYGGKLNEYLRAKAFVVFSRISYSVYLTQFLVFSHIVGSKRIPEMFTVFGSFDTTEFALVLIVSTAVTLLFDIPTVEVKSIVLKMFPTYSPQERKMKDPIEETATEATESAKTSDATEEAEVGAGDTTTSMDEQNLEETSYKEDESDSYEKIGDEETRLSYEYEDEEEEEEPEELNYEDELDDEDVVEEDDDYDRTGVDDNVLAATGGDDDDEPDFWASSGNRD